MTGNLDNFPDENSFLEYEALLRRVGTGTTLGRIFFPIRRRMATLVTVAWAPLAVLTLVSGTAIGRVDVPFVLDFDAHARLLIALPLLVGGELLVDQRLRAAMTQFNARALIDPKDRPRFDRIVASVIRVKTSVAVELVLLLLAFGLGHWLWREHFALRVTTWYDGGLAGSHRLTTAGYWYAGVSLPLVRVFLLRWYLRLGLWYWFLWRTSRIRLHLDALHPDRAGGLGFLGNTAFAFVPMLLAHTTVLSAIIAGRIWRDHAEFMQFKMTIVVVMALLLLIVLLPQAFFIVQLNRSRLVGLREYGALASHFARDFWRKCEAAESKEIFGTADVRTLAELGVSYGAMREMSWVPFGKQSVLRLAGVVALPFIPLILSAFPMDEAVDRAFKLLL